MYVHITYLLHEVRSMSNILSAGLHCSLFMQKQAASTSCSSNSQLDSGHVQKYIFYNINQWKPNQSRISRYYHIAVFNNHNDSGVLYQDCSLYLFVNSIICTIIALFIDVP